MKRSATSRGSARSATGRSRNVWPPDGPTLFVDRCAWSRRLGEALRACGVPHIAHHERFDADTPDETWLTEAGRQSWVVLTRDRGIRRKPDEIDAITQARARVISLTGGDLSAQETADLVTANLGKLHRRATSTKPPVILSISAAGHISTARARKRR